MDDYMGQGNDPVTRFQIKDSGKRENFESGMVRDTAEGKVDYSLALDGPLVHRLARHLTEGAKKYAKRNWMKAAGPAEYERFRESFIRHTFQYLNGETDEDHFAALLFNANGMEYVKQQMALPEQTPERVPAPEARLPFVVRGGDMPGAEDEESRMREAVDRAGEHTLVSGDGGL